MPILDLRCICQNRDDVPTGAAQSVADAVATSLKLGPGRVWVRMQRISVEDYAENHETVSAEDLPVFATVLHARLPKEEELRAEVRALTQAIAEALGRDAQRVHLEYASPGAKRMAFGGKLVD